MNTLKLFFSTLFICLCIDMTWLLLIAKNTYLNAIGPLMRHSFHIKLIPFSLLIYILIVTGILFFVLPRAQGQYAQALWQGALFGLIVYGIYDFTNYVTLAHWPLPITFIDMAWGAVLCGITSLFACWMGK